MKALKAGDRVRLKVRTTSDWKGCGTVLQADLNAVLFRKENPPSEYDTTVECCRHEGLGAAPEETGRIARSARARYVRNGGEFLCRGVF